MPALTSYYAANNSTAASVLRGKTTDGICQDDQRLTRKRGVASMDQQRVDVAERPTSENVSPNVLYITTPIDCLLAADGTSLGSTQQRHAEPVTPSGRVLPPTKRSVIARQQRELRDFEAKKRRRVGSSLADDDGGVDEDEWKIAMTDVKIDAESRDRKDVTMITTTEKVQGSSSKCLKTGSPVAFSTSACVPLDAPLKVEVGDEDDKSASLTSSSASEAAASSGASLKQWTSSTSPSCVYSNDRLLSAFSSTQPNHQLTPHHQQQQQPHMTILPPVSRPFSQRRHLSQKPSSVNTTPSVAATASVMSSTCFTTSSSSSAASTSENIASAAAPSSDSATNYCSAYALPSAYHQSTQQTSGCYSNRTGHQFPYETLQPPTPVTDSISPLSPAGDTSSYYDMVAVEPFAPYDASPWPPGSLVAEVQATASMFSQIPASVAAAAAAEADPMPGRNQFDRILNNMNSMKTDPSYEFQDGDLFARHHQFQQQQQHQYSQFLSHPASVPPHPGIKRSTSPSPVTSTSSSNRCAVRPFIQSCRQDLERPGGQATGRGAGGGQAEVTGRPRQTVPGCTTLLYVRKNRNPASAPRPRLYACTYPG